MGMPLLKKSEIAQAKARDTQAAIAEGLKLAKRVDALREVSATEEQSLEQYRVETLSNISGQIRTEAEKRDLLKEEIKALEERRVLSLVPIIEREIAVTKKEEELENKAQYLQSLESSLSQRQMDVAKIENATLEKLGLAKVVHTQATNALAEASTIKADAVVISRIAYTTLNEANANAKVMLENASLHDSQVRAREDSVFEREEESRNERIAISKEWTKLKDFEATLQRNLNRK